METYVAQQNHVESRNADKYKVTPFVLIYENVLFVCFLFNGILTFSGYFNVKSIFREEQ